MNNLATTYRSLLARKLNHLIKPQDRILEVGCGEGLLLSKLVGKKTGVDKDPTKVELSKKNCPDCEIICTDIKDANLGQYDVILLSDTLCCVDDAEDTLKQIKKFSHPRTRLIITYHNNLWRPILTMGHKLGLCEEPARNWMSTWDIENFLELSNWEPFKWDSSTLIPSKDPLSGLINKFFAPFVAFTNLSLYISARKRESRVAKKITVLVPVRNEAGTISSALDRTPNLGRPTEFIFVEGNSTDNTWEVLQALPKDHQGREIKVTKQPGKGKGDAVRHGFSLATGDMLLILDGDLTMPPEELPKYIEAMESGVTDVANGSRLVYIMDKKAMQFANLIANKFFGLAFSWLLGQRLKDTLCGTKVLWKEDYDAIVANRAYFGDFDPFGDFDLLFGAAKLNLKIKDIPIHYKERTYGSTNIQRWKHGVILLGMLMVAAKKLKFH
jgi:SAM-dependent methyltransferase